MFPPSPKLQQFSINLFKIGMMWPWGAPREKGRKDLVFPIFREPFSFTTHWVACSFSDWDNPHLRCVRALRGVGSSLWSQEDPVFSVLLHLPMDPLPWIPKCPLLDGKSIAQRHFLPSGNCSVLCCSLEDSPSLVPWYSQLDKGSVAPWDGLPNGNCRLSCHNVFNSTPWASHPCQDDGGVQTLVHSVG